MEYKNYFLTDKRGVCHCVSNKFENVYDVEDAVEDAEDGHDLIARFQTIRNYVKEFILDKENDARIRIKLIDNCGNVYYFVVIKKGA